MQNKDDEQEIEKEEIEGISTHYAQDQWDIRYKSKKNPTDFLNFITLLNSNYLRSAHRKFIESEKVGGIPKFWVLKENSIWRWKNGTKLYSNRFYL